VVGVGCLIFAEGGLAAGMVGFVRQAIGAIFGFIGASYVAARYLPASMLAIFLGLTQALGMAGAAFGTKPVHLVIDPAGNFHVGWQEVWIGFMVMGFVLALATFVIMPRDKGDSAEHHGALSLASVLQPFRTVFGNPQSWLAGIIGGLLFVPTTIGALVWATAFLHDGQHMSMADAASDAFMVPIGWVIGCPLLGYISDRIGLRKPVLIGGAIVMLAAGLSAIYVPEASFPRYSVPLILGIASGRDDPVLHDEGGEPASGERHGGRRHEFPRVSHDRHYVALHLSSDGAHVGSCAHAARIPERLVAARRRNRHRYCLELHHSRDR
jgi:hypothetical protein